MAITNARYTALAPNPRLSCIHELIKGCLDASPVKRLTTSMLLERLAAIAESNNFDPREPANIEIVKAKAAAPPPRPAPPPMGSAVPPPRPSPPQPPPRPAPMHPSEQTNKMPPTPVPPVVPSSGLFSSIFRNIKDTSSKVMHSVQQSMARTELDASYLTSRILIMPYPADGIESAYRANHVEDVRAYLQTRHPPPTKIQLYNLSRSRPNVSRLPGKHIDCVFAYASPDSNAPLLSALYQICQDIYRYLDADFNHMVVLYCAVSRFDRASNPKIIEIIEKLICRTDATRAQRSPARCCSTLVLSAHRRKRSHSSRLDAVSHHSCNPPSYAR